MAPWNRDTAGSLSVSSDGERVLKSSATQSSPTNRSRQVRPSPQIKLVFYETLNCRFGNPLIDDTAQVFQSNFGFKFWVVLFPFRHF